MPGAGVGWVEEFHEIALGTPKKGVIERFRVDHGPAGTDLLIRRCLAVEPDLAEVRVVLEPRH
ncbi:MAG: hypothetical protein ACXV3F_08740 [Frankiaceae bacterium]